MNLWKTATQPFQTPAYERHHVVPHDEGWAVRRANAERASCVTDTKIEAVAEGIRLAKRHGTTLIVHGKNGRIMEQRSYN